MDHISLQNQKYEVYTKLPQWSCQIQFWYEHCIKRALIIAIHCGCALSSVVHV